MSQWGWGLAATSTGDVPVQWWRWNHPDSSLHDWRPDRIAADLIDVVLWSRSMKENSRGVGGPSGTTPTSTNRLPSTSPQGRASAEPGKYGGPRQSSQRGGRSGRKECPKGHYWSYKLKKCVRSKFK